jgi:hypothetical protein
MYKSVFSFVLNDSHIPTKDPPELPREPPEDTKEVQPLVSFYYLHSYIILSVPPSLAGSHQGNLGKICPNNTMRSFHTNLINVLEVDDGESQSLAAPSPEGFWDISLGNTSQSIQLTRNLCV